MLYITGDTHGEYASFLRRLEPYAPAQGDTVIVLGDFGFVWNDAQHRRQLRKLAALPFQIAFIDGNHEDFDLLACYPPEIWHGGRIHRITRNIVHLTRGQVFTFSGLRIFTMGGAYSIDRDFRAEGVNWWAQELPNIAEYRAAVENLSACGWAVDLVLTHTLPQSAIRQLGILPDPHDAVLTAFLEKLSGKLQYSAWYAGHYHINRRLRPDLTVLFDGVELLTPHYSVQEETV